MPGNEVHRQMSVSMKREPALSVFQNDIASKALILGGRGFLLFLFPLSPEVQSLLDLPFLSLLGGMIVHSSFQVFREILLFNEVVRIVVGVLVILP